MAGLLRLLPLALLARHATSNAAPVIIVPGDGSNRLEAKLDKPSTVSWLCSKKSDWFRLWLDTSNLLLSTKCWADNIRLEYDQERDVLTNAPGVETRVPYWGSTEGFEELDPGLPFGASSVFKKMVDRMVSLGLERNKTIRGAPYDFRYAPSSAPGAKFIKDLKQLVEETAKASGRRVNLVSHSMGCLQVLYLLNYQTQAWKDKFVEKWIPLSGPFGGAAKEMRLYASGDNQGLPVNSLLIREEQRSYETNHWLLPVPQWWGNRTVVTTPKRSYTMQDTDAFFDDIGFPAGKKLQKRTVSLTGGVVAPGVDVVCMYSLGVDTPESFSYGPLGFDVTPTIHNGDGDGTVNALSLQLCERWPETQSRPAKSKIFSKVTHSGMISDPAVLDALMEELGLSSGSEAPRALMI